MAWSRFLTTGRAPYALRACDALLTSTAFLTRVSAQARWLGAHLEASDGRPRVFVRYEDLVINPEATVPKLCGCLGMGVGPSGIKLGSVKQSPSPAITVKHRGKKVEVDAGMRLWLNGRLIRDASWEWGEKRAKMEAIGAIQGVVHNVRNDWRGYEVVQLTDGREFPCPQLLRVKYPRSLRGGFAAAKARQMRNASFVTRGYTESDMRYVSSAIRRAGHGALLHTFGYRMRPAGGGAKQGDAGDGDRTWATRTGRRRASPTGTSPARV